MPKPYFPNGKSNIVHSSLLISVYFRLFDESDERLNEDHAFVLLFETIFLPRSTRRFVQQTNIWGMLF